MWGSLCGTRSLQRLETRGNFLAVRLDVLARPCHTIYMANTGTASRTVIDETVSFVTDLIGVIAGVLAFIAGLALTLVGFGTGNYLLGLVGFTLVVSSIGIGILTDQLAGN